MLRQTLLLSLHDVTPRHLVRLVRAEALFRELGVTHATYLVVPRYHRGWAIEKVLFAPFWPGTAHVVIVRPVFPARPIPGWAEKRQHGVDNFAQQGSQNGCGERISRHVTPHTKS